MTIKLEKTRWGRFRGLVNGSRLKIALTKKKREREKRKGKERKERKEKRKK